MSKLLICFISMCLLSCNNENESIVLRKIVQSSALQTLQNLEHLKETEPIENLTNSLVLKSANF